jgi:peptide/nickel transport system ATP-binding protein
MENENFIEVKDLVVEYTSDGDIVQAVNGVSFSLKQGETLGLVGETGAGKTTIAKSILRILPDPPAKVKSGQILLEGKDLMKISEKEMLSIRGNKISMIFQDCIESGHVGRQPDYRGCCPSQ